MNQQSSSSQEENLSSIPRLNDHQTHVYHENRQQSTDVTDEVEHPLTWENLVHGTEQFIHPATILIISQTMEDSQTTPSKEKLQPEKTSSNKKKFSQPTRQYSSSSETDSIVEHDFQRSNIRQIPPLNLDNDENSFDDNVNDFNRYSKHFVHQQPNFSPRHRSDPQFNTTTASDILLQRLSNQQNLGDSPTRKNPSSHQRPSTSKHHETHQSKSTTVIKRKQINILSFCSLKFLGFLVFYA